MNKIVNFIKKIASINLAKSLFGSRLVKKIKDNKLVTALICAIAILTIFISFLTILPFNKGVKQVAGIFKSAVEKAKNFQNNSDIEEFTRIEYSDGCKTNIKYDNSFILSKDINVVNLKINNASYNAPFNLTFICNSVDTAAKSAKIGIDSYFEKNAKEAEAIYGSKVKIDSLTQLELLKLSWAFNQRQKQNCKSESGLDSIKFISKNKQADFDKEYIICTDRMFITTKDNKSETRDFKRYILFSHDKTKYIDVSPRVINSEESKVLLF
jgi:hypothetical protein